MVSDLAVGMEVEMARACTLRQDEVSIAALVAHELAVRAAGQAVDPDTARSEIRD
jgi:hypothetical protein